MASKKQTIAEWKDKLERDDHWAVRALMRVYQEQTADERNSHVTRYANNVGFTAFDAELLTSFAHRYDRFGHLSEKQMEVLHNRIPKYAGQLYRLTYEGQRQAELV